MYRLPEQVTWIAIFMLQTGSQGLDDALNLNIYSQPSVDCGTSVNVTESPRICLAQATKVFWHRKQPPTYCSNREKSNSECRSVTEAPSADLWGLSLPKKYKTACKQHVWPLNTLCFRAYEITPLDCHSGARITAAEVIWVGAVNS